MPSSSKVQTHSSCNNNNNIHSSKVLVQPYYDGSLLSRFRIQRQVQNDEKIGKKLRSKSILLDSFAANTIAQCPHQQENKTDLPTTREDCEEYATQLLRDTMNLLYLGSANGSSQLCQHQQGLKRIDTQPIETMSLDSDLLVIQ